MKKSSPIDNVDLPNSRKIIFYLILIIFPIIILSSFELFLRIFRYGEDYSLFTTPPDPNYEGFKIVNPEIGAKYFQNLEYSNPVNDIFPKKKDENCFRVFVMGSSTVVGFPYEPNLMFSRILQNRLQSAYPDRRIEMINTAITAINSYTLLDFTDQILAEKPDAILIYAGHNEYYGAYGVGSNEGIGKNRVIVLLHLKLLDYKVYQLLRNLINKLHWKNRNPSKVAQRGTLMSKIVKNADIVYESKEYKAGLEQYRENMSAILEKTSRKKLPVFISTLVSNVKENPPFGSISTVQHEGANEIFTKAHYYYKEGNFKLAKEHFVKARDLDCIRFRASSDINIAIAEMAEQYDCYLVPMLQAFETKSPDGIVGNNLITEHVHPNIPGYFLMAEVFYQTMVESKIIAPEISSLTTKSETLFRNSYGYTELDSILGHHLVENLRYHWPFRDETKNYIDYRLIYKPQGLVDSLAFSHLLNKNSIPVISHQTLAKYYISRDQPIKAYREYKAMVEMAPSAPKFLREAASYFISVGDLPLSLKYFEQSLEHEPSFFAYFRAGEIYMIKNDFIKASKLFTKAFENADKENQPKILIKLYQCYVYSDRQNEAKKVHDIFAKYSDGKKINVPPKTYSFGNYFPIDIKAYIEKANACIKDDKPEQALKILNSALDINDSPVVNRLLGEIYNKKHDYADAQFFMEKAYPWFKYEPEFLSQIIRLNITQKSSNKAKSYLEQFKSIDPMNPEIPILDQLILNGN